MKQVCKTRKIRKTFVNLLSFCIGRDIVDARYRRFHFCYYFSVVVKKYEEVLDCLRVYVLLVCVKLPTLG